jgi:hypothetical protein
MTDNQPQVEPPRPLAEHHATGEATPPAIAYGAAGDYDSGFGSDDGSAFLADLARAMQLTAGAQRLRITEAADERRQAHIDAIRGREAAQTEELRELSERDVKGIESWATAEIERIRLERQRRIAARKTELERRLEQHHALVDREVAAVEAAVEAYRDEVDRFFGRLDVESDPIAIAREAGNLPPFPVLEVIGPDDAPYVPFDAATAPVAESQQAPTGDRHDGSGPDGGAGDAGGSEQHATDGPAAAEAVGAAAGEAPMVGVMDGAPPVPAAVAPWDRQPAEAEASVGEAEAAGDQGGEDAADADVDPLVGAGVTKITPRSSGAVIQSVPSLRPIGSWLRRSNHST